MRLTPKLGPPNQLYCHVCLGHEEWWAAIPDQWPVMGRRQQITPELSGTQLVSPEPEKPGGKEGCQADPLTLGAA